MKSENITFLKETLEESESSPVLSSNGSKDNSENVFLVLDNDVDKEEAYVGDYVTWILSALNLGPGVAKNTQIHDKLPNGLKYVSHTANKGTFDSKTGIWDIGDLSLEDDIATLLIVTKALTVGEKVNEAYISTDSVNENNRTFESEEMDVVEHGGSQDNFEKIASARMYETGNPLFLAIVSLFILLIPTIKREL